MGSEPKEGTALRIGKRLLLIIMGIVLALVLIELALRIAGLWISLPLLMTNLAPADRLSYRIVCLGESTTFGDSTSWPGQLQQILDNRSKGQRFKVYNLGYPGTTTALILANLETNIERYQPNMVISMMGINDELLPLKYERMWGSQVSDAIRGLRVYKLISIIAINLRERFFPGQRLGDEGSSDLSPEAGDYLIRGGMAIDEGNYSQAEGLFKKGIELSPQSSQLWYMLDLVYEREGERVKEIPLLRNISQIFPSEIRMRAHVAWRYDRMDMLNESEREYLSAIRLVDKSTPKNTVYAIYSDLSYVYLRMGDTEKQREMLERSLDYLTPEATAVYSEPGEQEQVAAMPSRSIGFAGRDFFMVFNSGDNTSELKRYHYNEVYSLLKKRNIAYVAMQYPTRDVNELRIMLGNRSDIIYVSNRENFERALLEKPYEYYFIDHMAQTFGHTTEEGSRLIAESAAKAVLAAVDTRKN